MHDYPTHGCCSGLAVLWVLILIGTPMCIFVAAVILLLVLR